MASGVTVKPLRILHLEDSPADHALACITLRRANGMYEIRHADTMESFIAWLGAERFDLILADYRLPGFTALDAWQFVEGRGDAPPFVLLSGAIGEAAAVDAIRLGMSDYLLKDDMGRLPRVIDRAIEVHEARKAREHATRELAASERRLAELTEHLQSSIEKERAAIAREIHDDIGGALTAVRFDMGWIARHTGEDAVRQHAESATEMLQHAIGASQRIMMNLRPPILDQGLVAAVQWLAESFERRTGISTRVHANRDTMDVPSDIQLVAYRTAQEALTNISKYAEARQVAIDLSDSERVLTLEVTDDGRGMEPAMRHKPKSFGLKGLEERARTVGGWLDISSHPGRGTSVIVSVPLDGQDGLHTADRGEVQ
ncbi:histidine kinase [Acidovorax sp. GBBC 3334]|uniref:hybrid sensor histidine kinase/response regulator n=1 Tax=Acidovorax sp. GBBC 3334 TaxID=2940496 RepID=UPI002304B47D|nr:ATP-binding protein [Acidovorax sp. GBBC 3334]MDA8455889.1 histidine kinase [Acidovorax sp. GBBC 3334]